MISVAVSCLNEEKNLGRTFFNIAEAVKAAGCQVEVIIINDGSTDRTADVAEDLKAAYPFVRVIHHPGNAGVAVSVKEALALARYPRFLCVPGSNDVSQDLLAELFKMNGEADLVIVYYVNRQCRGRWRNFLSGFFGMIYRVAFGVHVRYLTGPAIYSTERLRSLHLQSSGFSIFPEMTLKILLSGCRYLEVPGRMIQCPNKGGAVSLVNLLEVIVTYFKLLWEIKFKKKALFNKRPVQVNFEELNAIRA